MPDRPPGSAHGWRSGCHDAAGSLRVVAHGVMVRPVGGEVVRGADTRDTDRYPGERGHRGDSSEDLAPRHVLFPLSYAGLHRGRPGAVMSTIFPGLQLLFGTTFNPH